MFLRINKIEKIKLTELSNVLNTQRLNKNLPVLEESKVLHELIDFAFDNIEVIDCKLSLKVESK